MWAERGRAGCAGGVQSKERPSWRAGSPCLCEVERTYPRVQHPRYQSVSLPKKRLRGACYHSAAAYTRRTMQGHDGPALLVVGVLAMQGAFREHMQHIERLNPVETASGKQLRLQPTLVRNPVDLARCAALIIPGGESTAIALGAQRAGLLEPLREWVRDGKPTWGTCAGMILLAREATGGKKSGQELLGGLDIRVGRNGFGSQVCLAPSSCKGHKSADFLRLG